MSDWEKEKEAVAHILVDDVKTTNTGWPHEKKLHQTIEKLTEENNRLKSENEKLKSELRPVEPDILEAYRDENERLLLAWQNVSMLARRMARRKTVEEVTRIFQQGSHLIYLNKPSTPLKR